MAFASLEFIGFCLAVFLLYFVLPMKARPWVLLVSSFVYIATFGVVPMLVFLATVAAAYGFGLWIEQAKNLPLKEGATGEEKKAHRARVKHLTRVRLGCGFVLILGALVFLKYGGFIAENVNALLNKDLLSTKSLLLPLGISFYSLQLCGYLMDIYRGKCPADHNFLRFVLFSSWFPQILQGPIHRYNDLAAQLFEGHPFDWQRMKRGVLRMVWGFFKKLVIADRAAIFVSKVLTADSGYTGLYIVLGILLYGFQIYGDFSGGMDIACGISEVLGIRLTENFERPYLSKSVAEFWQRWHITLGGWMRDTLFYPLALSKSARKLGQWLRKHGHSTAAKTLPPSLATLLVFFVVGVWHGADWKYFVYGAYQAIFVASASLLEPFYARVREKLHMPLTSKGLNVLRILRTYLLISFGRFFAEAASLSAAFTLIRDSLRGLTPSILWNGGMVGFLPSEWDWLVLLIAMLMLVAVDLCQERGIGLRTRLEKRGHVIRWAVYIFAIMAVLVFGIYGQGFDSSNFIYAQF